jgi:hypothetical protein
MDHRSPRKIYLMYVTGGVSSEPMTTTTLNSGGQAQRANSFETSETMFHIDDTPELYI